MMKPNPLSYDQAQHEWRLASLIFIFPIGGFVLATLATMIPYVGSLFVALLSMASLVVFYWLGFTTRSTADSQSPKRRNILRLCMYCTAILIVLMPRVIGYYTHPVRMCQQPMSGGTEGQMAFSSYSEASHALDTYLTSEFGSAGVLSYVLFVEDEKLSAKSFGEYIAGQFEDIDGWMGVVVALINVLLNVIPILIKLVLHDVLGLGISGGFVGLGYWLAISLGITAYGWKQGFSL